jgi:hypothetical protein
LRESIVRRDPPYQESGEQMSEHWVTAVMNEFGGAEKIDAYGWAYGPLRVERGGGIAGHLEEFWITFPGSEIEKSGPYRTRTELRTALRDIFVGVIKLGVGLLDCGQLLRVRP